MDKQRHIIFLTTLLNVQARSVILWKPDKPEVWKRLLQTKKARLGVFDVVDCSCYLEGSFNRTHCLHPQFLHTDCQHLYHCFNITMAAISNDNHEATTNIDSTKVGVEMKQQLFHEKGDGMKGEKDGLSGAEDNDKKDLVKTEDIAHNKDLVKTEDKEQLVETEDNEDLLETEEDNEDLLETEEDNEDLLETLGNENLDNENLDNENLNMYDGVYVMVDIDQDQDGAYVMVDIDQDQDGDFVIVGSGNLVDYVIEGYVMG